VGVSHQQSPLPLPQPPSLVPPAPPPTCPLTPCNSAALPLPPQGKLKAGWVDTDGADLYELTWAAAKKISPNLTPQQLGSSSA
jgi:hypothetical protein